MILMFYSVDMVNFLRVEETSLEAITWVVLQLMKAELNSARTSAKMVDGGDVKGDTKCLALVKYTTTPPEYQIKVRPFE
ncbi:hypothetical protein D5086_032989 [Populus alba]|uniref:Uncharacterized protein n=1 Tax=Populus alba TaxID=43335 RepID=A0ACC4AFJ5_POPAL